MAGLDGTASDGAHAETTRDLASGDHGWDRRVDGERLESAERGLEATESAVKGYKGRELREFRAQYDGEFIEPLSRSYPVERFDDPDRVVSTINPRFEDPSGRYNVNCADCARAVERTWRGAHEEAAGRLTQYDAHGDPHDGELSAQTEDWAAERFAEVPDPEALRARLEEGGHGSSAIVHTQFSIDGERGAHAYNVVNHHGRLRVLDGQTGETFAWEQNRIYDLGDEQSHVALAWNGRGEHLTW